MTSTSVVLPAPLPHEGDRTPCGDGELDTAEDGVGASGIRVRDAVDEQFEGQRHAPGLTRVVRLDAGEVGGSHVLEQDVDPGGARTNLLSGGRIRTRLGSMRKPAARNRASVSGWSRSLRGLGRRS